EASGKFNPGGLAAPAKISGLRGGRRSRDELKPPFAPRVEGPKTRNHIEGDDHGTMKTGLVALALAGALPALAAELPIPDISYQKFTLENGLTVIVHEDHKA